LEELGDDVDPAVRAALDQELMNAREAVRANYETALLKALEPRQRTRLEQVQLQAEGPFAFARPDFEVRLNLSPDQVEAVGAIIAKGRVQMFQSSAVPLPVRPGVRATPPQDNRKPTDSPDFEARVEEARQATLKIRASTMLSITNLLTRAQRANYTKMLGQPFDLANLRVNRSAAPAKTGQASPAETKPGGRSPGEVVR
jgi:hypothetical protein